MLILSIALVLFPCAVNHVITVWDEKLPADVQSHMCKPPVCPRLVWWRSDKPYRGLRAVPLNFRFIRANPAESFKKDREIQRVCREKADIVKNATLDSSWYRKVCFAGETLIGCLLRWWWSSVAPPSNARSMCNNIEYFCTWTKTHLSCWHQTDHSKQPHYLHTEKFTTVTRVPGEVSNYEDTVNTVCQINDVLRYVECRLIQTNNRTLLLCDVPGW